MATWYRHGLATLAGTLGIAMLSIEIPAQTYAPAHTMADMPASKSATPPIRMEGIGNATMEITTTNPEAKTWFLQGLNLLHDFWDYESERAFTESIRLDPACAMCWWGLSEAQQFRTEDSPAAKASLAHAKSLRKKASPAERLYIEAAMHRQDAESKKSKKEVEWPRESKQTQSLRKLVAIRPDEAQARIYLAESLFDGFQTDGTPKPGTAAGQAMLQQVLAAHPEDSAANHYWIHAVEAGNHPEMALESARKLAELSPASGHMVHMPGHIFYRTGDYEAAQRSFEHSMEVDETYMRDRHVAPDDDWNYVHNLMYLIADLVEEGHVAAATAISSKLNAARGSSAATLYRFSTRDGLTRLAPELPVVLRGARWTEAGDMLDRSHPDANLTTMVWLRRALLEYVRGMAALETGDVSAASSHQDQLDAMLKAQPVDSTMKEMVHPTPVMASPASKDLEMKPVRSFVDVAAMELRGSVLMANGKRPEADAAFLNASNAEKALGYHEPPNYIRPVGETRGDALLRAGRYTDAKGAYEAALKERPNSGYPLYGIARAEAAAKDDAGTTAAYQQLLAAWKTADPTLPQVKAALAWMSAHGPASRNAAE